jgi:hypothetical protein
MTRSIKSYILPLGLILFAMATVTTARADEIQVSYNLAAKKSSDPILIPATNTPVSLTGVQTQVGFRGVGQATILRVAPASFLEWVGMDIATGAISTGFSATPKTHIIWLDFSSSVDVEVANATSIRIHNSSSGPAKGTITMIW